MDLHTDSLWVSSSDYSSYLGHMLFQKGFAGRFEKRQLITGDKEKPLNFVLENDMKLKDLYTYCIYMHM